MIFSLRSYLTDRPPSDPKQVGRLYFAWDTSELFRDNGNGWDKILFAHRDSTGRANDDHAQYLLATGARAGATAGAQEFTSGSRFGVAPNCLDVSAGGVATFAGTAERHLSLQPEINQDELRKVLKPDLVSIGVFTGYSMPVYAADNEEIFAKHDVPGRWDGASDITVDIMVCLSANEDVGDYFKFQLSWNHAHREDGVVPAVTHDVVVEQIVLAGRSAQYSTYDLVFTLDYDIDTPDDLEAHDLVAMRLYRIDATNPDVNDEIYVLDWHMHYQVDKMFVA